MTKLSTRALNRAVLARQLLLERASMPIPKAVEAVAGLQAQIQNPPYIGLWSRLKDFERDGLTDLMNKRQIVRSAMLRSTLHLFTAPDFLRLRKTIEPALEKGLRSFFGKRIQGLDIPPVVAAARKAFHEKLRPFSGLNEVWAEIEPERDPAALAYVARTYLPLVQVPPAGTWGSGAASYALADDYLGKPISEEDEFSFLLTRYLGAFGPASVKDLQAWVGMPSLANRVKTVRASLDLRTFQDENGVELFDLPDAPLPDEDTPAPVRFLPDLDNFVLSHADRTRAIADVHRPGIFLTAGRVRASILVDGFVVGAWKVEREKKAATLIIEPFVQLAKADRDALAAEGERLIRFIEDKAERHDVRFDAQ